MGCVLRVGGQAGEMGAQLPIRDPGSLCQLTELCVPYSVHATTKGPIRTVSGGELYREAWQVPAGHSSPMTKDYD